MVGLTNNQKKQDTDAVLTTFGCEIADREKEQRYRAAAWPRMRRAFWHVGWCIPLVAAAALLIYASTGPLDRGFAWIAVPHSAILLAGLAFVMAARAKEPRDWPLWTSFLIAALVGATNGLTLYFGRLAWLDISVFLILQVFIVTLIIPSRFHLIVASAAALIAGSLFPVLQHGIPEHFHATLIGIVCATSIGLFLARRDISRRRHAFLREFDLAEMNKRLQTELLDVGAQRTDIEKTAAEHVALLEELAVAQEDSERQSIFLTAVLENISQGVCVFDKDLKLAAWNQAYKDILELPDEMLDEGKSFEDFIRFNAERGEYGDVDVEEAVEVKTAIARSPGGVRAHNYERRRWNGTFVEVHGNPMPGGGLVSTYTDITARKRAEETIHRMALEDALTGLANRNAFKRKLDDALRLARRQNTVVALAMIDLDHFKPVNDTHGHPIGDELLKAVAEVLQREVREVDTVARLGGDEFAIIFAGIADKKYVDTPTKRIIKRLSRPIAVGALELTIGASVGVAHFPDDAQSGERLIKQADDALYAAKDAGRGVAVKISA